MARPSRLSGESRNPRPLSDGPPPSFRRKPESTSPLRRPTPVFPAKAGIHVPSPMAHPRLSGESRNPRPLPDGPPPSFRRKPESTPPPRWPTPVFPAKAGIHAPSPMAHPRLSGESRNPCPLPIVAVLSWLPLPVLTLARSQPLRHLPTIRSVQPNVPPHTVAVQTS